MNFEALVVRGGPRIKIHKLGPGPNMSPYAGFPPRIPVIMTTRRKELHEQTVPRFGRFQAAREDAQWLEWQF